MNAKTMRDDELIAIALGDAKPSPHIKRWLNTGEGRREFKAYQETLEMLNQLYADVKVSPPVDRAYYSALRTPVGRVFVAATDAGLARVSFNPDEAAFVSALRRSKLDAVRSAEKVSGIVAQLETYFAGKRSTFDVPIDWRRMSPFQHSVLAAALQVPAGQVVSYHDIARRIGQPQASRAVGQALGHNPMPIVIPCHRVVSSGGGLGGYTGGLGIKQKLLQLEGALQ
jgi:methylated-DNA-[protein]-cysteine S-methyltransferase